MTRLSYKYGAPLGSRANLGVIVLRTDETLEHEFRMMMPADGVALYTTRIPCETEVTPEALGHMEAALAGSAAMLPHSLNYDVIAYACTSAATIIGPQRVAEKVRLGAKTLFVTDPLTAVLAACGILGVQRLGFLSPYVPAVSAKMRERLEEDGRHIASFASFEEESDENIARIDPASIRDAALHVGSRGDCDAVFMSCTNLRAASLIPELEATLGIPVLTSNQALAWHMLSLSGISTLGMPFGHLMDAVGAESNATLGANDPLSGGLDT
jgi:maleate isomerase